MTLDQDSINVIIIGLAGMIVIIVSNIWVKFINRSIEKEENSLIRKFVDEHGRSPTNDEIIKMMGGNYERR